jgi:membrane-associated protease RseP (regulator of RpoE activity)
MTIEDTKPYLYAPVVFKNGQVLNAKLLMDSGASHGLMLEPTSSDLIQVPENAVSSLIGRGLGGEIVGKVGRIESISLGSYTLENAIANFPDPNSYSDSIKIGNVFRNGAIGGEILSRFTVIFNFPAEKVYIKKNSSFRNKFYYNLSGITIKAKGSRLNSFEVTEVRDQSPGQTAGIQPGDQVLSLNGVPAKELDLNVVNGFLNSKPGRKVKVEISRSGVIQKLEIQLKDQI